MTEKFNVGDVVDWNGMEKEIVNIDGADFNPIKTILKGWDKYSWFNIDGKPYSEMITPCLKLIKARKA